MASNDGTTPTLNGHSPDAPRGGAPAGNTNRATHGLYGVGLPKGCQRVGRRLNSFRRSLCAAVEAVAGSIDLTAAAAIDSACHWQRHLLLAARWLRLQHAELKPDQRLTFSREVARAASERDKCIRALRLNRDTTQDIFDALYATPAITDVPPAADATRSPNAAVGDVAADSTSPSPRQED